ncbi:MAG: serine/threonine protein kinase, partial [Deltaproteobacteria bacterium]|nr:serine/threonine protein kinase [Kofleriaceae bacterium]
SPAASDIASTATTPLEAMRAEEVERTRAFSKLAIAIGVFAVLAMSLAAGDPLAKALFAGAVAIMVGAVSWLLLQIREPQRFTPGRVILPGMTGFLAVLGGVLYWGVASPASAVMLFGIYFFALGQDLRATLAMISIGVVGHLVLAILVMTEAMPDIGVIKTGELPLREQIISQVTIQLLYASALFFGRRSRRATMDAVERLDRAVRAISMREALLAEVRQELDRALKVGGPGRYTEQEVGSYRLGNLIGRGGMGEVYDAKSVHDGTDAAVKLLHPSTLADPQAVARFLREAEVAARLESEHLCAVYEVGMTAGEIPFIAMERLRGFDLAHHLRRSRRLSLAQVLGLIKQIAAGLSVAHRTGVVHRDIKPHNLFLSERDGRFLWKLLDFGVSKLAGSGGTLTAGHVVGTPGYMSPEQARGEDVDLRTDVYALATIAYRCLTGHPAFTGKDVPTTLYDVVYKMPTRPSVLAELPEDVDRVLAVGMAKDRADRFGTPAELAAAMTLAADSQLDGGTRARADALVARHAWGQRL